MTNFEKIEQMSIEEMAEFIADEFKCPNCDRVRVYNCNVCVSYIKRWLESEVLDDE